MRLNEAVVIADTLGMTLDEAISAADPERSAEQVRDALVLLSHAVEEYAIEMFHIADKFGTDVVLAQEGAARHRLIVAPEHDGTLQLADNVLDVVVPLAAEAEKLAAAMNSANAKLRHPSRSVTFEMGLHSEHPEAPRRPSSINVLTMSNDIDDVRLMMIACIRGDKPEMARLWEESPDQTDLAAGLSAMAVTAWRQLAHANGDTDEDLIRKLQTGA